MQMTELIENDDRMAAQWRLDRFVRQFEPGYRSLVQVVAVPIVLTPELVGYLRGQFLPTLTWVAEADLLLSELCRPVGYERYVMDSGVQAIALRELERENPEQVEEIARLLVGYMQHLARVNPYLTDRQRKHQQWAAMLCVAELRGEAIGQISAEFEHWQGAIAQPERFGVGRSELAFLDQVLQEQLPRLLENGEYLKLARRVSAAIAPPSAILEEAPRPPILGEQEALEVTLDMSAVGSEGFPALQTFEFETVSIDEPEPDPTPEVEAPVLEWRNKQFKFETATLTVVEPKKNRNPFATRKPEIVIRKGKGRSMGYIDRIDAETWINLIAIPGGTFEMGAPEGELEARSSERPQHSVTVPEFWMGQSPVTQAQWKAVAGLPQVNIKLEGDPSRFKGANLPVERVSWDEAVEFCDRLSIATGRTYRLPSEAQWEYACRAGTTTPFHFGETIEAELANYDAKDKDSGKYGKGRSGEYREKTTPVGTFPANDYGLYDMHGNVWEWCADDWHSNYEGAPTDSSVWDASNDSGSDPESDPNKVIRGGSWYFNPWWCRSASRLYNASGSRVSDFGFRVVVVASLPPRTLR
jgi:formylglycine-generating enzyme required for sulfatase activity